MEDFNYLCSIKYVKKMIQAALFDMDGTLVANSPVHFRAFDIFCKRYGVTDWQEKLKGAFGMGNDDIIRSLMPEEIIREKGSEALAMEKEAIYREIYAPEIRSIDGLVELLRKLRDRGIRCAVGSSACMENVNFVLDKCHLAEFFEAKVSGEMVARCKPHPDIYLLAAETMGVAPADCVVFEDARAGIESARRATAGRLVALATTHTVEELVLEPAIDLILPDYRWLLGERTLDNLLK